MRKILEQCPTCGGPLVVTELQCSQCQTQVRARYSPCPFCALTAEQLQFVKLIIETRGNLREMEKALGVSYPTVRGKLEEVAQRLAGVTAAAGGGAPTTPALSAAEAERRTVLQAIAEGKLSAREGLARLRATAGNVQATGEPPAPETT